MGPPAREQGVSPRGDRRAKCALNAVTPPPRTRNLAHKNKTNTHVGLVGKSEVCLCLLSSSGGFRFGKGNGSSVDKKQLDIPTIMLEPIFYET